MNDVPSICIGCQEPRDGPGTAFGAIAPGVNKGETSGGAAATIEGLLEDTRR